MKIIRAFVTGLVGLVTILGCAWLGAVIAMETSHAHDLAALVPLFYGGMIGLFVGVIAAIPVARFFADSVWVSEENRVQSTTSEIQQQLVIELETKQIERERVEKYGQKIVICSSCGTKNSLSFQHCIKCSKDLGKEQPVDNPYL